MNIGNTNIPKQAQALLAGSAKVSTYEATGGEVTSKFASYNLSLLPPGTIRPGSVIHDNACGSGTVTRHILFGPHAIKDGKVKIFATDIDQPFLDKLQEDIKTNGWEDEVKVQNVRSEEVKFEDGTFDLDVMNIGIIFCTGGGLDGTKQIYRTLKEGGTAIVNCWHRITWLPAVLAVNAKFRLNKPFPAPPINWIDGQHIQKIMQDAGFSKEKMKIETNEAWVKIGGGEEGFRAWCEKTWAYLAGIGGWLDEDEKNWDGEIAMLMEALRGMEGRGYKVVDGEVWLMASQWVVVAEK